MPQDKKQAGGDAPVSKKEKDKDKSKVELKDKDKSKVELKDKDKSKVELKDKDKSKVELKDKDKSKVELKDKDKSKVELNKKEKEKDKSKVDVNKKKSKLEVVEEVPKTESQIRQEEAEYRSMLRKQKIVKRWPEITRPKFKTRKWAPPPPPQRMPPIPIELPELTLRHWVPPYRRRRRPRPKLPRVPPEEVTKPLYEFANLKKIWHNFTQVEKNKMILQGSIACNSKRYSSTACGSQTGCIALVCRALLEEKAPSELVRRDVDECIDAGDRYYRQCMLALKCYKGKPQLMLNQLLNSFFLHDIKYTVKMSQVEKGILAKHPDNVQADVDLMALMEKRKGTDYMMILTVGDDRHFLIWGHPPPAGSGTAVKTVCYLFDPHMLNELGQPDNLNGAGAFLRFAGVTSFVLDFLANYGDLTEATKTLPKPPITLTNVEVVQIEPLIRDPDYELDLKALKIHCKSEWESMNINALIEKKRRQGKYPLASLSAVSLATSRTESKRKMTGFYQKTPKQPPPALPVPPEKPPPPPTIDEIMAHRGEDFFLYCPKPDVHLFGRDDLVPLPKSETILYSPVDKATSNFQSQFQQIDAGKWILRATRHMASHRYQTFKTYTGVPCIVTALGMLRRIRARGWNEDILDETLDLGYNYYRESLGERGGPVRRLVLGELKEIFKIRDKVYKLWRRGIAVWGKLVSTNVKVFDLYRGIEAFFKESDAGMLQIPGEYETAIFNEGGRFYLYHPWPADKKGYKIGLQDGGKACLLSFSSISHLCDHFMDSVEDLKRKPFAISDISVIELKEMPDPVNNMKPVAPGRWVMRGRFHEGDVRFPEEHRNRQGTPNAIVAIALSHVLPAAEWTPDQVDDTLVRGDTLYQNTIDQLEKMGISLDTRKEGEDDDKGDEEQEEQPAGMLAAADVINKFKVSDYDCIETEVLDSLYNGSLNPDKADSDVMSLKDSLDKLFKKHTHAVVIARGGATAVWKQDGSYYFFDPHGCDENGYVSDDVTAKAALVRVKGTAKELADVIMGNLAPGADDTFNISPIDVIHSRLIPELGAPEAKLDSAAYEWFNRNSRGKSAIMMGPRGENTAIGKAAQKASIGAEDLAGRTLALPAAAAFCAAASSVPPPHMHQDHMFNIIEAGTEYYLNHVKKTGNREIQTEDLSEKFEMGANTFSIELEEPIRLPLRLPDKIAEGEGGGDEDEMVEGEEVKEEQMKEIKDALFKQWYDTTKPAHVNLLVGDYHQMGVWVSPQGKVIAFDPAPTLMKGMLTPQRIKKGDEIRLQRIKDEMTGEGGDEDEDEELGGEGEEQPEAEPEFVPPESCPVLMVFASPQEFVDKLVSQGPLDKKQMIAPYKLFPVKVTNELTSVLREKRGPHKAENEEVPEDEEEQDRLVEPLSDEAVGKYFINVRRGCASVRGKMAQNENYFMEDQRDIQDAANVIMGIVVEHIEPYTNWKPSLIDSILKYGDRLYTLSLPRASKPPTLLPEEVVPEFKVTSFNIRTEVVPAVVQGDIKAGETGAVLNLRRGLDQFFSEHKYGVLCCKGYCFGIWRAADGNAYCVWDPHCVGPAGRISPGGGAGLILHSTIEEVVDTFKSNMEFLAKPGSNKFSIASVKVSWEIVKSPPPGTPGMPDEGYDFKVLTAFVEMAKGRTILRGTRPPDLFKFSHDSIIQSSCGAIVAACMSRIRQPHLWSKLTVDETWCAACPLFAASVGALGYEFRPGEEFLLPPQVLSRFVLGANYVRYDMQTAYTGKLEQKVPTDINVRAALEHFFEKHTHGILWSVPHAVAVWKVKGSPTYYMMEPHACGPTGLRIDEMQDDGAACVMTFTSPKLMAYAYLQNYPAEERYKHEFVLYEMRIVVTPIKKLKKEPPLIRAKLGENLVPATSKVHIDGVKRRADEMDRAHPPGSSNCLDAQRAAQERDREAKKNKGQRSASGWLVLSDGTQFLSANHSMACSKFPPGSRNHQALACSVMAVAMSRVLDVCRWCSKTLDEILESGDQLYQDSYLHFKPQSKILTIEQILRKFYTPGNCVCRVVVYQPRQHGTVDGDLEEQLKDFYSEEKSGVLVAGDGQFAVALFRTPRGFYMFDPADRDRYGRALGPACAGRALACFSQFPNVSTLAETLRANVPPFVNNDENDENYDENKASSNKVRFAEPARFIIYGMSVSTLRRLDEHER